MAVATENALTLNELEEEKERLQSLLEVNASLVANFDLQSCFPTISGYIRKVVNQDFASITIFDESTQCMRKFTVDCPPRP